MESSVEGHSAALPGGSEGLVCSGTGSLKQYGTGAKVADLWVPSKDFGFPGRYVHLQVTYRACRAANNTAGCSLTDFTEYRNSLGGVPHKLQSDGY